MSEFKVGDKVRVREGVDLYAGHRGVIEAVLSHGTLNVRLAGSEWRTSFAPVELALAEEPPRPASMAAAIPENMLWKVSLHRILGELGEMMAGRHKKYGPGNIAKHGPTGILVRMDDKFARLESGQGNFDDETIENTLDDIIGYAIIWKMWIRGEWPGSEVARRESAE